MYQLIIKNQRKFLVYMQIKYLSLLAILPLFVGIIIGSNFSLSSAAMYEPIADSESVKPNFVAGKMICGDRFCDELDTEFKISPELRITEKQMEDYTPRFELISVNKDKPNTDSNRFTVTFKAIAGPMSLEDITLRGYSDVETITVNIGSLTAHSDSTNVVKIKAMDPSSITGELLSFRINSPEWEQ